MSCWPCTGGRRAQGLDIVPGARVSVGISVTENRLRLVAADLRLRELAYKAVGFDFGARLSEDAALDYYTEEDFEVAAQLIEKIANELGLEYSIDPSNDSQNEYARVITIKKNGKLLGRINSDAKTDVGDAPSLGWIIGGGILIGTAAVFAVVLIVITERKKKKAA